MNHGYLRLSAGLLPGLAILMGVTFAAAPGAAGMADAAGEDACAGAPVLPDELAGWRDPVALPTAATGDGLVMGRAVDAELLPVAEVTFAVQPEREPSGHGGLFRVMVGEAGAYRVALGGRAWIDMATAEGLVPSAAHGHGPECSGIRKMVDFVLTPGPHFLQLSGSAAPRLSVMVVRLP